jgi:hypothetical protein
MNDIQLAVRGFMTQSSVGQIQIMRDLGYTEDFDYNISIQKNNMLFIEWLKRENKVKDFVDKCKIIYGEPIKESSNDNHDYSINTKELIYELDKWMDECDIMIKEFSEVGMENSMLSSMAMKTAYSNVKKIILEKSK